MTTIWKSILMPLDTQEIDMPIGAEILCAREQMVNICVWYRCDPLAQTEKRKFAIIGTGQPAPADGEYIGSAAMRGGRLMFHVFCWP